MEPSTTCCIRNVSYLTEPALRKYLKERSRSRVTNKGKGLPQEAEVAKGVRVG